MWMTSLQMFRITNRRSCVLCDQVELLKETGIPLPSLLSYDNFHPNAVGYKIMAKFLLQTLEEHAIIPSRPLLKTLTVNER